MHFLSNMSHTKQLVISFAYDTTITLLILLTFKFIFFTRMIQYLFYICLHSFLKLLFRSLQSGLRAFMCMKNSHRHGKPIHYCTNWILTGQGKEVNGNEGGTAWFGSGQFVAITEWAEKNYIRSSSSCQPVVNKSHQKMKPVVNQSSKQWQWPLVHEKSSMVKWTADGQIEHILAGVVVAAIHFRWSYQSDFNQIKQWTGEQMFVSLPQMGPSSYLEEHEVGHKQIEPVN